MGFNSGFKGLTKYGMDQAAVNAGKY